MSYQPAPDPRMQGYPQQFDPRMQGYPQQPDPRMQGYAQQPDQAYADGYTEVVKDDNQGVVIFHNLRIAIGVRLIRLLGIPLHARIRLLGISLHTRIKLLGISLHTRVWRGLIAHR